VSGKGVLSQSWEKIKDFQFCLPILPAYLPLKFPNRQFPLKIPGPISQATLEEKNKKNKKFTRGGVYTWFNFFSFLKGAIIFFSLVSVLPG
jgi:hypothetical protein